MKKTPLKQKTPLKRKTPLKAYKSLKSRKGIKSGKKIRTRQKTAKKLPGPYRSIFTDDMGRCYITGDWNGVEPHHVFQGQERKIRKNTASFSPCVPTGTGRAITPYIKRKVSECPIRCTVRIIISIRSEGQRKTG